MGVFGNTELTENYVVRNYAYHYREPNAHVFTTDRNLESRKMFGVSNSSLLLAIFTVRIKLKNDSEILETNLISIKISLLA